MTRRTAPDAGRAKVASTDPIGKPRAARLKRRRPDAARRRWDAALDAALAPDSTPETRLESALVAIDAHLNGIVRVPAMWGDAMSAEMILGELLFLRTVLLGVEPSRWGGEALSRAKIRRFRTCNGPCSNWIGREDYEALRPLLAIAVKAERKRHGVPSKVPTRRRRAKAVA